MTTAFLPEAPKPMSDVSSTAALAPPSRGEVLPMIRYTLRR
ncbi:hypothetical protein [Variovorax sp. MHTC-1]|nr:hypothetical protein [Variovorax sp. MHTC-1]